MWRLSRVLHGLLRRWLEEEKGAIIEPQIRDDAELWALNSVYCTLETILSEPFAAKAFPENKCVAWRRDFGRMQAAKRGAYPRYVTLFAARQAGKRTSQAARLFFGNA